MVTYRPSTRLKLLFLPSLALLLYLLHSLTRSRPLLHPIPSLLSTAATTHATLLSSRSTTLRGAYDLYLATHGRVPPAGFDAWFYAGRKSGVCNLDRFEEMYRSLEPWWAMKAGEIRERGEEAGKVGFGRVRVREGKVVGWEEMEERRVVRGQRSDARNALEDMLNTVRERFGVRLPDVDFYVNGLDEPRVLVPYELRSSLENLARRGGVRKPQKEKLQLHELGSNSAFDLIRQTCPPSSLARTVSLSSSPGAFPVVDQTYTSAFTTPIGNFLSSPNLERETWCDQPDIRDLHASFVRPLSFSWTNQMFPIFSNSKIYGYNDILIPAWFYWYEKMPYVEADDVEWKAKSDNVFWRGSNTGGRSEGLNWIGWLRSRLVSRTNRPSDWNHFDTLLLADPSSHTTTTTLPSHLINSALTDIAFSSADQHGEPASLDSQRTEPSFRFTGSVPFRTNYASKAIFDVDGTAYSGRFVALLRSRSAVFKARLYLEALDDGLIPWYHYVPVSVRLSEMYSLLGYFFSARSVVAAVVEAGEKVGKKELERAVKGVAHEEELREIAEQGREWGMKCTRREDAMSYAHLLALEWARLQSDGREGFRMEEGEE